MPLNFEKKTVAGLEILEVAGDPEAATLLLFHGYGADAYDLLPLASVARFEPKPTFLFPQGPIEVPLAPGYTGKGWFSIDVERLKIALQSKDRAEIQRAFPENLEEARTFCLQLIATLDIPLSKLILGGFSQGALLAIDLALHLPEKIRGLIVLSGILVQEERWGELAALKKGIPFFQSHGLQDPLLPLEEAKALTQFFQKAGFKGELHTFQGGHDIPPAIMLKLYNFLKSF